MYKTVKYFLLFLGLFVLDVLYSSLVVEIVKHFNIDILKFTEPLKSVYLIIIQLSLMLIVYFIFKKEFDNEITDYFKNFKKYFSFGLKMWGLGLLLMITSNAIIHIFYTPSALNENIVRETLKNAPLYTVFAACIFAPFIEETIFRKSLKKVFKNDLLFIIMSGLLFGLAHNIGGLGSLQMLYIIPYGLFGSVFAYTYVKTENIFVSATFHFIHNTVLVFLMLIFMTMGVL